MSPLKNVRTVLLSFAAIVILTSMAHAKALELDESIQYLTDQTISKFVSKGKLKIAVIEFSDLDGKTTELGKYLAEELTSKFFASNTFNVVERQLLSKVMLEQKLNLTGVVDQDTAKKLGKVLGVDAICTGTITDMGDDIKINARLVATETGAVLSAASVKAVKDSATKKLMGMVAVTGTSQVLGDTGGTVNITGNLIMNGDFKQGVTIGWKKELDWNRANEKNAGTNFAKIEEGILHISHTGDSTISLTQDIKVISAKLIFKAKAKLLVKGYGPTQSRARIRLLYMRDEAILGDSLIEVNTGAVADKASTPRHRYFFLQEAGQHYSKAMQDFVIDIADELSTYLIGINPEQINKIRIVVSCDGITAWDGSLGQADLWISNVELKYR